MKASEENRVINRKCHCKLIEFKVVRNTSANIECSSLAFYSKKNAIHQLSGTYFTGINILEHCQEYSVFFHHLSD